METNRSPHVVVGVDNTPAGLHALRRAVAEARARNLPLEAVRAWSPGPASLYAMVPDPRAAEVAAASQVVARAFADTMGGLPVDVAVETVLVPDVPGAALVRSAARDDDLLVVGAGHHRWRRLARTVRYCLTHAPCPVLVVPPPPLARESSPRVLLRQLRRDIERLGR